MTDKLRRDVTRGQRAKALLEDDTLQDIFAELEAEYVNDWKANGGNGDVSPWYAMNSLRKLKASIARRVADGKLAQRQLEDIAKGTAGTANA